MQDIVVRSTITTQDFVNTGFIHIKDFLIEGIFSLDYLQITLDGSQMILHLATHTFEPNYEEKCFLSYTNKYCYTVKYRYSNLFIPDTYYLYDMNGSMLKLDIGEKVNDSIVKKEILSSIEKAKYSTI